MSKRNVPILLLFLTAGLLWGFDLFMHGGGHGRNQSGAPSGVAGDPAGDGETCAQSGCHTGTSPQNLDGLIQSDIPSGGYVPGNIYTITASISRPGHSRFGFQISPQNSNKEKLGTLKSTGGETQLVGGDNGYITHTSSGTDNQGGKSWSFDWKAPSAGTGKVTFYGAFNVTNSDNLNSGDSVFVSTLTVSEDSAVGIASGGALKKGAIDVRQASNGGRVIVEVPMDTDALVDIDLVDLRGRVVQELHKKELSRGTHELSFDIAESNSSGIFFVRMTTLNDRFAEKILLQ